ncbi:hypothetical protein REPUB_Repub08aG0088200 [Reevesia pubescens]
MVTTRSGIEIMIASDTLATEILDTEKVQSGEEAYELHHSRKSIDATSVPGTMVTEDTNLTSVRQGISYRDLLLGDNYGSFTKATETVTSALDENHNEIDEPMNGQVYGRPVGYRFLACKLGQLWSRIGKLSIVDLGHDFYLIKFQSGEDYNYVIKEGPWFIAGQFLTLRKWEPNFRASEASFTSVAVWVRLPELPVEYFDLEILRKIGQSLGVLLRADGHTLAGERGKYARICVQVSLERPLPTFIKVDGKKHNLVYESVGLLCFSCGKLGHLKPHCPERVLNAKGLPDQAKSSKSLKAGVSSEVPTDMTRRILAEDAGPWQVVPR